jgi:hypothetical protein
MPRADLAELFASRLASLPTEDGRELRFLHFSTFGQAEDTKARVEALAKDVGNALVYLATSNGYEFSHPSDPVPERPSGHRIAPLICPGCGNSIAGLPMDAADRLTPNAAALQSLALIGNHSCLSNHP